MREWNLPPHCGIACRLGFAPGGDAPRTHSVARKSRHQRKRRLATSSKNFAMPAYLLTMLVASCSGEAPI